MLNRLALSRVMDNRAMISSLEGMEARPQGLGLEVHMAARVVDMEVKGQVAEGDTTAREVEVAVVMVDRVVEVVVAAMEAKEATEVAEVNYSGFSVGPRFVHFDPPTANFVEVAFLIILII